MNYKDTLDYMFTKLPMYQRTGKAAYKANLDTTLALDEYFKHPHKNFKTIHVAGTNGKGSVSHTLASVLQTAGLKVGLYTSPHLRDFRERIKINGELIPEESVINFVENHKAKFEELTPSFFEMTVAMAFEFFAIEKVDIAIVEVGLGGRLDSTNIISPLVSVITNISKDHTNLLGSELMQIAGEKAGIIKNSIPVIVGETQNEIRSVFEGVSSNVNAPIYFADESYSIEKSELVANTRNVIYKSINSASQYKLKCDLLGNYQVKNIRTALCVIDELNTQGWEISDKTIQDGIANIIGKTGLLGRWQILNKEPLVVCDTGHNTAGIKEILVQIASVNYRKLHIVIGMVDDKNIEEILNMLPKDAFYYFTKANIPRALDEINLKDRACEIGLKGNSYSSVKQALNSANEFAQKDDMIFIGGSTFVVAEVV